MDTVTCFVNLGVFLSGLYYVMEGVTNVTYTQRFKIAHTIVVSCSLLGFALVNFLVPSSTEYTPVHTLITMFTICTLLFARPYLKRLLNPADNEIQPHHC